MVWVDSTDTPQVYADNNGAVWDSGDTKWDLVGNIAITYWDVSANTSYTDTTNNTQVWVES